MALLVSKNTLNNIKFRTKILFQLFAANMNFDRLRYIAERTELGEHKEAIFAVTIPEQKGAFLNFCRALQGRNITEFNYRASDSNQAQVFVGIS
jgi:threonine dehydratase